MSPSVTDSDTRRRVAVAVVVVSLAIAGCLGGGAAPAERGTPGPSPSVGAVESTTSTPAPSTTPTTTPTKVPGLDSTLLGLVRADDRATYAAAHDLDYRDGRVAVVVELGERRDLPSDPDVTVESRYDRLIQGRVAVDDLPALARHGNVSAVRPPNTAVPE